MSIRQVQWDSHFGKERDYLCVDAFIADMVGACALSTAFETGVIDYLIAHASSTTLAIQTELQLDQRGLHLLLGMLRANRVLESKSNEDGVADATDTIRLSASFKAALVYRDLMEAKLYFANLVAPDFLHLLTALLMEPAKFVEQARIFKLFSYQRAFEPTAENYEQTARWMRITTALTKYEAQACIAAFDFSRYQRMLDIGGNSGEFVLRVCRKHPELRAAVYDLPLVCDIGAKHVADEQEAARISFIKRDPTQAALPRAYDLITFKSMLHDWPDAEMCDFLRRAYDALEPGGTLMIFERTEAQVKDVQIAYGQLPLMLFFRSYRTPQAYQAQLEAIGFHSVTIAEVPLDMPFILITAIK